MSLADIRMAIKASLEAIPSIGKVTDWEPAVTRDEDFKDFFIDDTLGYILGWSITRETTFGRDATNTSDFEEHAIVIRGYRAIDNAGASEHSFQDLIELVRAAIRDEEGRLWNGLAQVQFVGHPNLRLFEARLFGAVLVHYCEVTVLVTEHVTVP